MGRSEGGRKEVDSVFFWWSVFSREISKRKRESLRTVLLGARSVVGMFFRFCGESTKASMHVAELMELLLLPERSKEGGMTSTTSVVVPFFISLSARWPCLHRKEFLLSLSFTPTLSVFLT